MKKSRFGITSILLHLELIFICVIVLAPLLFILGSAFGNFNSLANASPIPDQFTLVNFQNLFTKTAYLRWYLNTFIIALGTLVMSTTLTIMAGYIFGRIKFRGRKAGLLTMMVLQTFPSFLSLTALYVMFLNFGFINNPYSLILLYSIGGIPGGAWLVMGYFKNVPVSLDEAAQIDGASRTQIFFKILFPLSRPIMVFLAVTSFMAPWMDFIFPRLIISTDTKKTLAVGLYEMINNSTNTQYPMFAAGAILVAIPITILFYRFQSYFVDGILSGSDK